MEHVLELLKSMQEEIRTNQVKADTDRVQMQAMFRTYQEETKADRKRAEMYWQN